MNAANFVVVISMSALLVGCASTTTHTYSASGPKTICQEGDVDLGTIAVLPETAWRDDQKEPEKRKRLALGAIESAFRDIPCGDFSEPGGLLAFNDWSSMKESEILEHFSNQGVDTIVLLRLEELTPHLYLTFSIPFLWAGASEADFRVRAIAVEQGDVLTDMRVKRTKGGPFYTPRAEWSRHELNAALHEVVKSD